MNNTAKLYYMFKKADVNNKKLLTEKDIYNLCHDKWIHIRRACDNSKTICHEAIHYIAALEFLFQNTSQEEITFTRDILIKKSHHKKKQRSRFLAQIGDIYHIQYHNIYNKNGKKYHFTYSAKRTENALKILENPKKFYREEGVKNVLCMGQKRPLDGSNLTPLYNSNRKDVEEIENISTKDIFSISNIPIIKTTVRACAPAREETPMSKPRIRVAAISERMEATTLEQSNLLCSPCGAASQISSAKEMEDKTCLSDIPINNDIIIENQKFIAEESREVVNDQSCEEPPFHKHSYLQQPTTNTTPTSFGSAKERFNHDLNVRKIKIKIRDSFDDKHQAEEVVLRLKIEQPIPGRIKLVFPRDITLKPEERYKLRGIIMDVCGKDINIVSNLKVSDVPVTETFDDNIAYDPCYVPITQRVKAAGQIIEDVTKENHNLFADIIPMPSTSCGTKENMQKIEDVQPKVENSLQISWEAIKRTLSGHYKFYLLTDLLIQERKGEIVICHSYSTVLESIIETFGDKFYQLSKEHNVTISIKSKDGRELQKYDPNVRYIADFSELCEELKSKKRPQYLIQEAPMFSELAERLDEMINDKFFAKKVNESNNE